MTDLSVLKLRWGSLCYLLGTVFMILPIIAANKGITTLEAGIELQDFGWSKFENHYPVSGWVVGQTYPNSDWSSGQGVLGYIFLGIIIFNFAVGLYLNFLLFQRNMEKNQDVSVATCQKMGLLISILQIAITVIFQQAIIGGILNHYGGGSFDLPLGWGGGLSHAGAVIMFVGMLILGGAQGAVWTVGQQPPSRNMQMMMANGQQVPTIQSSGAATSQQVGMVQPAYGQPVMAQPAYGQQQMVSGGGGNG